jgi:CHASE2 domain-containing sensor protein/predicted Ser/Thr protein kinase
VSEIPSHNAPKSLDAQPTRTHAGGGVRTFPESTLPVPGTFPGYDILSELNRGGQGVVYLARQHGTLRDVAVKVPLGDALATAIGLARFQREIESVARLRHTNVVSVFHPGRTSDGRPFFVMEYVDGLPLITHIQARGLTTREIVALAAEVCDGLDAAHCAGVIHRDLKPGNILVDRGGHPRILDFGLARSLDPNPAEAISTSRQIMGTLAYMAPEQARGDHLNTAECADIHAIGVILFQALTGVLPYPTDRPDFLLLQAIIHDAPIRPSAVRKEIHGDLETIILKCLDKEPRRRYRSAAELGDDLRRYLRGEAINAKTDSAIYLARKQVERGFRRYPVSFQAAGVCVVVLALAYLVRPIAGSVTARRFERWVVGRAAALQNADVFRNVRVIGITNETDFGAIAKAVGLTGFDAGTPLQLRRLHGKAMEQLAALRPRAVAWDIKFISDSPFDQELADGFRALERQGIPVVCAAPRWWSDGQASGLATKVEEQVRWGTIFAGFDTVPPQVQLAMQSGAKDVLPSLSLATVAAARHPAWEASYSLALPERTLTIQYYERDPTMPQRKLWHDPPDRIRLADIRVAHEAAPDLLSTQGIQSHDQVAIHSILLRADALFRRSTIDYSHLFEPIPAPAVQDLMGKIVIVADQRSGVDEHTVGSGRVVKGCYAHATAVEELLYEITNNPPLRSLLTASILLDLVVFAGLGWGLSFVRVPRAAAAFSMLVALSFVASYALATRYHALWDPTLPCAGAVLAAVLTRYLRRIGRPKPVT